MPELPEVEIVRQNLERWAQGRRILKVTALRPEAFRDGSLENALQVEGHTITGISRRGKALWMATTGQVGWLMRFGMTGKWVRNVAPSPSDEALPRFTRVRVDLEHDPYPLCFVDMRNFGGLWGVASERGLERLREEVSGVDPILDGLPGEVLEAILTRGATGGREGSSPRRGGTRRPIKVALMEQSGVAGVGNIYASEALFRARIHPKRPPSSLSSGEFGRLADEIVAILQWAIAAEAADEVTYQGEVGAENPFQVYGREGTPCPACGTPIERTVLAQRSTFWCPRCQPA